MFQEILVSRDFSPPPPAAPNAHPPNPSCCWVSEKDPEKDRIVAYLEIKVQVKLCFFFIHSYFCF